MIYVNLSLLYGIRLAKPLLLHWTVGMGMLPNCAFADSLAKTAIWPYIERNEFS
jgi:hypothetical protein